LVLNLTARQSGASIQLNDNESTIILRSGYIADVNSILPPTNSCIASSGTYPVTGNGRIKDYSNNLYIQNETISTNQHYIGNNIYVGNNVTPHKSQGNVTISGNNTHVILDAEGNVVLDKGFKIELGSTLEIK
jgi:hypothetical protein